MIEYSFCCDSCGFFHEMHSSTRGQKQTAFCPECKAVSARVYQRPHVFRMNGNVKSRIENGMAPRIVKKEELHGQPIRQKNRLNRPWQV